MVLIPALVPLFLVFVCLLVVKLSDNIEVSDNMHCFHSISLQNECFTMADGAT